MLLQALAFDDCLCNTNEKAKRTILARSCFRGVSRVDDKSKLLKTASHSTVRGPVSTRLPRLTLLSRTPFFQRIRWPIVVVVVIANLLRNSSPFNCDWKKQLPGYDQVCDAGSGPLSVLHVALLFFDVNVKNFCRNIAPPRNLQPE